MTITRNNLTRVFIYSGCRLPDPDPSMSPLAVRDLFAAAGRPELSSAEVRGPELVNAEMQFTLHRAVGTKGTSNRRQSVKESPQAAVDKMRSAIEAVNRHGVGFFSPAVGRSLSTLTRNKEGGHRIALPSSSVAWLL